MYFCFCYLIHIKTIYCLDGIYYNYIVHSDSIMGTEMTRYNFGRMDKLGKALLKHIQAFPNDTKGLCFPVVYLGVMDNVISRIRNNHPEFEIQRIRSIILNDLGDPAFFIEQIHQLTPHRKELKEAYGRINSLRLLTEYRYYADGRIILYWLHMFPLKLLSFAARCKRKIQRVLGCTQSTKS